jgi:hypothetical protein
LRKRLKEVSLLLKKRANESYKHWGRLRINFFLRQMELVILLKYLSPQKISDNQQPSSGKPKLLSYESKCPSTKANLFGNLESVILSLILYKSVSGLF